jgi:hypothetical protein
MPLGSESTIMYVRRYAVDKAEVRSLVAYAPAPEFCTFPDLKQYPPVCFRLDTTETVAPLV